MNTKQMRTTLDGKKGQARLLQKQIEQEKHNIESLNQDKIDAHKARAILQEAAIQTQNNLRIRLSSIVTTALRAVFEKDIRFNVTFDSKRGRTECMLEIEEDGYANNPMDCHGGGVVDVASFALRCAFWSMDRTRPVMILDEPFKFLSHDLVPKAADMIRMIADELGLQIIMVTHIMDFVDIANKVFMVSHKEGISQVVEQ